jgi:hypothetical protein
LLPGTLIVGPRFVIPSLEIALLAVLIAINPVRMTRTTRWSRQISLALIGLIAVTNLIALIVLLKELATVGSGQSGILLLAAGQVWLTNVIVFGLAYWELDRGGPVTRTHARRTDLPKADFRFSQDENLQTVTEVKIGSSDIAHWVPTLVDVSLTNSSAFSPTDTMRLSSRVKILMGLQATAALVTSVLVIAKGVGGLGSG